MQWCLDDIADVHILNGAAGLQQLVRLDRGFIIVLLGNVPGAALIDAIGRSEQRFGARWSTFGRAIAVSQSGAQRPYYLQLDRTFHAFARELHSFHDGEAFFLGRLASGAARCGSLFLDDGYADADHLPDVAHLPAVIHRRRWLHMGIASMMAFFLPTLDPMKAAYQMH